MFGSRNRFSSIQFFIVSVSQRTNLIGILKRILLNGNRPVVKAIVISYSTLLLIGPIEQHSSNERLYFMDDL